MKPRARRIHILTTTKQTKMSQDSQNLNGFDENIVLSNDSHTGLSDKIEDMCFGTDDVVSVKSEKSARSVKSARSGGSVKSARSVKSERSGGSAGTSDDSDICVKGSVGANGRKPRAAAISANQKLGVKRKFSSSSESSSSSYKPSNLQVRHVPGSATKKKKNDVPASAASAASAAGATSVTRITHVVQTSKNGRVVIEGLCVTKKTGQVFYPQDSIYIFKENDENINDIKNIINENKKKWIENGHSAVCFSQTFNGSLPTVIGGFTRGFAKSIFK